VADFFLNCTKNTELTPAHFARTVSFALIKNLLVNFSNVSRFWIAFDNLNQQITLGAPNMKSEEWNSYRTRFLVNAKQLNSNLSFVDHLGRQHRGRKGDYLVESSDGVISIAPRRIFEDIYVPMQPFDDPRTGQTMIGLRRSSNPTSIKQMSSHASSSRQSSCKHRSFEERSSGEGSPALRMAGPISPREIDRMHFEALQIEQVKLGKPRLDTERLAETISARPKALGRDAIRHDPVRSDQAAAVRKFPQPCRDPRASALSLM
jgi:hypothetical protein